MGDVQVVVDKAGEGKAEKPLLDDPVHLLPGIGPETVNKLKDLAGQTKDKEIHLPFDKIETGLPPHIFASASEANIKHGPPMLWRS